MTSPPSKPAHAAESEATVLAGVFSDAAVAKKVRATLEPNAFHDPAYRAIALAAWEIMDETKTTPPDIGLVLGRLRQENMIGLLEHRVPHALTSNGKAWDYILQLQAYYSTPVTIDHHIGNIVQAQAHRSLFSLFGSIQEDAQNDLDAGSPEGLLRWARRFEEAAAKAALPQGELPGLIEIGTALTPEALMIKANPIRTGIAEIDAALGGGWFAGELAVIQAATGMGKTTLTLAVAADGVSEDPQRSALYGTTEMSPGELEARRACQLLNAQQIKCSWRDVLTGVVPLERTRSVLANSRVFVLRQRPSDTPIVAIRNAADALAQKHGKPPLIVADYLQALCLGSPEERRIAVGGMIYEFQALAETMKTPVIVISSVGRSVYTDKKRRESDDAADFLGGAKEAGEIEYAGAVVVHLDVKADEDEHGWRDARFIVVKSRFGRLGVTGLRFHGASGIFTADAEAALSEYDRQILDRIASGTYSSANAVAVGMKNAPKVKGAVARLLSRNLVIKRGGYLHSLRNFTHISTPISAQNGTGSD